MIDIKALQLSAPMRMLLRNLAKGFDTHHDVTSMQAHGGRTRCVMAVAARGLFDLKTWKITEKGMEVVKVLDASVRK